MPPQSQTNTRPATWEDIVRAEAETQKVPADLALAVARRESSMNPDAIGDGGKAVGMFQLHPGAATDTGVDRADPVQNIRGGVGYLRQQLVRYNGDVSKALHAYNGGAEHVDKGTVSPQAQAYAAGILADLSGAARAAQAGSAGQVGPTAAIGAPTTPTASRPQTTAQRLRAMPTASQAAAAAPSLRETFTKPFDPRTPEGRTNDVAMLGSIAGAAITRGLPVGPLAATVARVLSPALVAGTLSGAEVAVENATGTAPQRNPVTEGAIQGGLDIAGQALLWPFRHVARGLVAPKVAFPASEALQAKTLAVGQQTRAATMAVREQVEDVARAIKQSTAASLRNVVEGGRNLLSTAKRSAATLLADTELGAKNTLRAAQATYDNLLKAAPSALSAGAAVKDVLEGPAKRALNLAGQAVEDAARTGPAIPIQPVKDVLADLASKWRPSEIFQSQSATATRASANAAVPGAAGVSARTPGMAPGQRISVEEYRQLVNQVRGEQDLSRLPGLLGKIQDVESDTIPFDVAHTVKQLLDEAVNWDQVAKKSVTRMTKAARIALRETMGDMGHAAYETATAVYHGLVPIYRKGIGKKVTALAASPDGASRLAAILHSGDASQALTLKNLLVGQAAQGGDAAAGLNAWTQIRSNYTYDKILSGGIDNLASRLTKLTTENPEFARVVYGDPQASAVLTNLSHVADAYAAARVNLAEQTVRAKALGAAGIAEAKDVNAAALSTAKAGADATIAANAQTGRQQVRATRQAGENARNAVSSEVRAFNASKMRRYVSGNLDEKFADVVRAGLLLPHGSYWGAVSLMNLLKAPSGKDLLQWIGYSNRRTKMLVRALSAPGFDGPAASALLREMRGVLSDPSIADPNAAAAAPAAATATSPPPSSTTPTTPELR